MQMDFLETSNAKNQYGRMTNRWREWLVPALLIGVILISFFVLLLPQANVIIEAQKNLKTRERELERLVAKRQALEDLSQADLDATLQSLENVLPSYKPVFATLIALQEEAETAGVRMVSFDLSPGVVSTDSADVQTKKKPVKVAGMDSLELSVDIEGSSDSLTDFLEQLETSAPLLKLDQVGLSQTSFRETSKGVTLNLQAFFAVPSGSLGKLTSPLTTLDESEREVIRRVQSFSVHVGDEDEGEVIIEPRENPFSFGDSAPLNADNEKSAE